MIADRKRAALVIDSKNAEVTWTYAQVLDPYGVCPDLTEEEFCVGRLYFARDPGSSVWVWFGDLPGKTGNERWNVHRVKLAFPVSILGDDGLLDPIFASDDFT